LCYKFVTSTTSPNNFLAATCALAYLSLPADPSTCESDPTCKACIDNITDFPDDIATILKPNTAVQATSAPTSSCPPNLLNVGLTRQKLSSISSGIQIEFFTAGAYKPIFALLDSEITACGGCNNIIYVNGSSPTNQALLLPGNYRVTQITGFDSSPTQPLCTGAVGYDATTWYSNPNKGNSVSTPLGLLYESSDLICNPAKYPNCPASYQCCVWDKATQLAAWTSCMTVYHANPASYPKCG